MTIPWWHPVLGDEEAQAVVEVIASGFPNDGELTERFAARIADISGVAHGVGVSSGSAAIYCALVACGVGPGAEVIVPDLTFVATANAVLLAGAEPVLADVRRDDFTLDPVAVADLVTSRTRAIVPVHVNGRGGSIAEIVALARSLGAYGRRGRRRSPRFALRRQTSRFIRARRCLLVRADEDRDHGAGWSRRDRRPIDRAPCPRAQGSGPRDAWYRWRGPPSGCWVQLQAHQRPGGDRTRAARSARPAPGTPPHARGLVCGGAPRGGARRRPRGRRSYGRGAPRVGGRPCPRTETHSPSISWRRGVDPREFWLPLHTHPPFAAPEESFPNATLVSARGLWLPSALSLTREHVGVRR